MGYDFNLSIYAQGPGHRQIREVMFMKIEDKLNTEQKQKLNSLSGQTPPKKKKKRKRKPEHVNWHEIMGMNRDTYKRHNGAIRRK